MNEWSNRMRRFLFVMDDHSQHWVVAQDMQGALRAFDTWRLDPRDILCIEEHA